MKDKLDMDKIAKTLGANEHYPVNPSPQYQAYEKWLEYWKTTVDWSAHPQGQDVWDAAIETVANYVLCFEDLSVEEISKKIKTLKTE